VTLLPIATVLSALAVSTPGAEAPAFESPTLTGFGDGRVAARTATLDAPPRHLAGASWWGGTYTVASGETVTVYVSRAYSEIDSVRRQWAEFFAGLVHGQELSLLRAYIAPLDEVQEMCGSEYVIGCYGGQMLVTVGDSSAGEPPASIAAHEYGHHIAANRNNEPWRALDWGTKRWATAMGICGRVKAGTAFPGDEGANYSFNPGEAFAESYRVLIETNGTAVGYDWPIVDPSFGPNVQTLEALREDVVHPWTSRVTRTLKGSFLGKRRSWTTSLATPLDGDLRVAVTVPDGGADDASLLSSDGRTVLSTAAWNSAGGKLLEYRICGTRSVRVRVTRAGAPRRFTLRLALP
jgi:hypothetical protein